VLKVVSKRWGLSWRWTIEWPEPRGHEDVGSGEGVPPSLVGVGPGEGAVPLPRIFFLNFAPGNGAFGALFVLFSTVNTQLA